MQQYSHSESSDLSGPDRISTHRETMDSYLKTEFCKFYALGCCKYGKSCRFAHFEEELRPKPDLMRTQVCRDHAMNACDRGDACPSAHPEEQLLTSTRSAQKLDLNDSQHSEIPSKTLSTRSAQKLDLKDAQRIPSKIPSSIFEGSCELQDKRQGPTGLPALDSKQLSGASVDFQALSVKLDPGHSSDSRSLELQLSSLAPVRPRCCTRLAEVAEQLAPGEGSGSDSWASGNHDVIRLLL